METNPSYSVLNSVEVLEPMLPNMVYVFPAPVIP